MHSRIIQVETEPVKDLLSVDKFDDHWFIGSIADYVDEDYEREDTLNTLREIFSIAGDCVEFFDSEDGCGVVFKDGFREAFFAAGYEAFQDALSALKERTTLEKFIRGGIWQELYDLNAAYDNEAGYYISNDELGLKTLSRFIRLMKTDTRYYFGGTLDYHF